MDREVAVALIEANTRLTAQIVELATAVIGAKTLTGTLPAHEPLSVDPPLKPFEFSHDDDWEDIPAERLHMNEEEEDATWQHANGQLSESEMNNVLEQAAKEMGLLNTEVTTG